jgi:predicted negative regulator of RcsB-dependent stress response
VISEGQENKVDTQTRHALKKDKFAQATASSVSWVEEHRSGVLRWVAGAAVALVLVVAAFVYWNSRSAAADVALGGALEVYNAPLAHPGDPQESGVYTTASARAQEANREFVAVSHDFGWLSQGAKAHYFAGITYGELGQNGAAETELKSAAGSWDKNLSSLAKLALAGLYQRTSRDSQAIDIYNALTAHPTETVPSGLAQLDLADLYVAEGKQEQARAIWAKVKDSDKDGPAGAAASEKLSPR